MKSLFNCRKKAIIFIVFLALLLPSQAALATSYVNFNNGKTFVFPDSCICNMANTGEAIVFTAIDGSVYYYALSTVASITETPIRELPSITTFKFNKKYNYQVIADATGLNCRTMRPDCTAGATRCKAW